MAQMEERGGAPAQRARLLLRQRPAIAWALAGAFACALAAGAGGAALAAGNGGGELIERQGDDADAGRDAEDGAGAVDAAEGVGGTGAADDPRVVVDVSGAVASPRVVELAEGSRVEDAIAAAGGLADDADTASLNRAAKLADGQKVHVPREGEAAQPAASAPAADAAGGPADGTSPVNINTAGAEELDSLPGVGPSTASAIIEDREANGPFASIEDIMRVSGIGEKKFEKLKSSICV